MDRPTSPPTTLLTAADVRGWLDERAKHATAIEMIDRKLDAVSLLLPPEVARQLLGPRPVANLPAADAPKGEQPLEERPTTDLILHILKGESGGRDVAWIRERLAAFPRIASMMKSNPNLINTSLSRQLSRRKVVREGRLYFLPELKARIDSGETVDDGESSRPLTHVLHEMMQAVGEPFKAGDVIALAAANDEINQRVQGKPEAIYGWLSRQVQMGKLIRIGEHYHYPTQRDEALNGKAASASIAGEVAASPFENREPSIKGNQLNLA